MKTIIYNLPQFEAERLKHIAETHRFLELHIIDSPDKNYRSLAVSTETTVEDSTLTYLLGALHAIRESETPAITNKYAYVDSVKISMENNELTINDDGVKICFLKEDIEALLSVIKGVSRD